MTYQIRPARSEDEISIMASFSILTILETVPEARIDPTVVPKFSHDAMATMYRRGLENSTHQYLVACTEDDLLVGHSIYLLKHDKSGSLYGYLHTRYVLPPHRQQGIGGRMLDLALGWFQEMGALYAEAHTHVENMALQALFASRGFQQGHPFDWSWPTVPLTKSLK